MVLGDRGSRWRCLLVWASGTSTLALVTLLVLPRARPVWTSLPARPLDAALVDVSACVVLGCALWAWLALTATVVQAWPGAHSRRGLPRTLPGGVRRVVLAACGVAVASALGSPARADDGHGRPQPHGVALLSGLPLPDRAVAPVRRHPAPPPRSTVTVRPGDSLWSIAEHDLPAGAPDRAIDERWRAIYAANHDRIGPDPDVLQPGQLLHLPRHTPRKDRT